MKIVNFLIGFIICLFLFGTGYYTHYKTSKPIVEKVTQEKIVYKTIYRDYGSLSDTDCINELRKYDLGIPVLNITASQSKFSNEISIHSEAGLNERTWSRDATITVGDNGWIKFGIGCAIGAGVITGLVIAIH